MNVLAQGKFWSLKAAAVLARQAGSETPAAADSEENTAELLIYGDIGESWSEESVTAGELVRALADLDGITQLAVRINSYGGSVADGLAIYNALRRHPAHVTVDVDGVAVSIASLIAMAGDTVRMAENALFMVHAPWSVAYGNARDMEKMAQTLDTFADAMVSSYANKSGQSAEAIRALLTDGEDHWYTAAEAQAMGFADELTPAIAAAAHADLGRFKASLRQRKPDTELPEASQADAGNHPAAAAAVTSSKESTMDKEKKAAAAATPPADKQTILAAERKRRGDIRQAFAAFTQREGVQALMDSVLDDPEVALEGARARLLEHLGQGSEPLAAGVPSVTAGDDSADKARSAMGAAILARSGGPQADGANPYRGMSLREMARASLERSGIDTRGMDSITLAKAALGGMVRGQQTSSDFTVVLENTLHKMVLMGFEAQPTTYARFCKLGDVSDLREWKRLVPGLIGDLDAVNEAGEYKDKQIPDAERNSVQAKRRGNILQVTPEIIINDDLGYVTDAARGFGGAGNRAVERAVYALLAANPVMADGFALFSSEHGNLAGSGGAPNVTTLAAAADAMAAQKAPGDDQEYLDIQPAVAVARHSTARDIQVAVDSQYDPDANSKLQRPNKVRGLVSDVVGSPRVAGGRWDLFADPNVAPAVEVVFLDGQRQPRLSQEENFRTGGVAWRVELPFGVGAIDYRGAYRNPGA